MYLSSVLATILTDLGLHTDGKKQLIDPCIRLKFFCGATFSVDGIAMNKYVIHITIALKNQKSIHSQQSFSLC